MKVKKIFFFIFIFFVLIHANQKFKILVSVDNEAITKYDIESEIKILKILNGDNNITKSEVENIAIKNLIEEKIKIKEIENKKVTINKEEIDKYFNIFISNSNLREKKESILLNNIKKKIEIDVAWNRLINQIYGWKININMEEINNKIPLEKMQKNFNEIEKIKKKLIENERKKKIKVYSTYHVNKLKQNASIIFY